MKWKQIGTGQFVMIKENEKVPCDILILATGNDGICYVETAELDGLTNLKMKTALQDTQIIFGNEETLISNLLRVEESVLSCEIPNNR